MYEYDYIIIGGGFFGSMIAQSVPGKVLLIEKEADLFTKASKNNQARVHNGYHYPRNYMTAWSSYRNYARFINEFRDACSDKETFLYPIAYRSKTTAKDFEQMYRKIGAPIEPASEEIKALFNPERIEEVFIGQEATFDYIKLKEILLKRLMNVDILYNTEVRKVTEHEVHLEHPENRTIKAKKIILCVYSATNDILAKSGLPELPLVHEDTIMPLVTVPERFKDMAITIMDGYFFSVFPFPSLGCHSIHHVRYTPNGGDWETIKADVLAHVPALEGMEHIGDIKEVKTILKQNEVDDGRPIMYRKDYNLQDFDVVVGGKLDNIYDLLDSMKASESLNIV